MSVLVDIWDGQDDSWESLADRTISMLELHHKTSCQNEDEEPEMEDDRKQKETIQESAKRTWFKMDSW